MKGILTLTLLLMLCFISCNNNPQKKAGKDSTEARKKGMDHMDDFSVKFATDAAISNLKEIELGKLAEKNANYSRVKEFAAKMVTAHTKANAALGQVRYSSDVTLPSALSENDQKHIADFADKKGPAFDKAYMMEMVDAHQKILEMLDKAASRLKDSSLKKYAVTMQQEVTAHLDEARNILEDVRKQYRPEQGPDVSH